MTSYELSISPDYVPDWGIVEAMRELFQNALDEETRDPENKMFYYYNPLEQTFRIGNKHSVLDARTLLLGYTEKHGDSRMIGSHGEGYKIATVVLLRQNKQVTFYNYGARQIWRPRFVNSRKYRTKVPTFFVEKKAVWDKVPDNDLVIEVSGITPKEYRELESCNLHIVGDGGYIKTKTEYGDILRDAKYKGKVFVGGLYICDDPDLEIGVDLLPHLVKLERDRSMVNSFDLQYYVSKMIESSDDIDLIYRSLQGRVGEYIRSYNIPELSDSIALQFLEEHGYDAVPVSEQNETAFANTKNTVIVSRQMKDFILGSSFYKEHHTSYIPDMSKTSVKLNELCKKIQSRLNGGEIFEFVEIINEVREMEKLKSACTEKAD